jgi:catechol 2,3-dioxygenase-like lactoylglutathione lyase family enzyme
VKSPYHYIAAGCQQIAFVVEDIESAERFWADKIGVSRFCRFNDIQVEDSMYRGGPGHFGYHLSLAYSGDMQIELIQHLFGQSIYKEFLDQQGQGMHHLGYFVDDHEKVVADFAGNGFPIVQSGRFGDNPPALFAYFDTRAATGIYMETIKTNEQAATMFAAIKRGDF